MKSRRFRGLIPIVGLLGAVLLFGCELVPSKPDAVFVLYRDRMKSQKLTEARQLLSEESRNLASDVTEQFRLKEPAENFALLNVLDPVTPPVVSRAEDNVTLLQVRTLKGGVRLVRLVRSKPDARWSIDISRELSALKKFLRTRRALDTVREQAGEYAASWRAFSDQLGRMKATAPPVREKVSPENKAAEKGKKKARTPTDRPGRKTVNRGDKSKF
ncbi:MAG: hypothetical protein RDU20_10725 [Desulfomonilaceae bacterium]|nr:hypothetical protein [Desulfomonilaceae bacterium]